MEGPLSIAAAAELSEVSPVLDVSAPSPSPGVLLPPADLLDFELFFAADLRFLEPALVGDEGAGGDAEADDETEDEVVVLEVDGCGDETALPVTGEGDLDSSKEVEEDIEGGPGRLRISVLRRTSSVSCARSSRSSSSC